MILGFQKQFIPKILAGTKVHTIRKDPRSRWLKGMKIHFASGIRTKNYQQFYAGVCTGVQDIVFNADGVYVDWGRKLDSGSLDLLAERDGFDTVHEMMKFFRPPFSGRLIHWTNVRY